MKQRLIRTAGGLVAGALVVLLVAGPATAASADGGPDRVAKAEQASGQRPGFGDRITPPRPGFGDGIQPRSGSAHAAPRAVTSAERDGGWLSASAVALATGIALAGAGLAVSVTLVRRRQRLAQA